MWKTCIVENFNGAGEYQTPSGWQKPEVRHEVIHVKRGRDVEMDVVVTRHGPIVSADIRGESRQLALKWALLDTGLSLPFLRPEQRAELGAVPRGAGRLQRAGAERGVCGRGRQHRLPGGGEGSGARLGRRLAAGERRRRRARVDGIYSVRRDAERVQPAVGDHRHGQRAGDAGRLQVFDHHGVGVALPHGAHLPCAAAEQEVYRRRHARAADRRAERPGQVCGAADGLRAGPDSGGERAGAQRSRYSAALRRQAERGFGAPRRSSSGRGRG